MPILRKYNSATSTWDPVVIGAQGNSGTIAVNAPVTNSGTTNNAVLGIDPNYLSQAAGKNIIINGGFDFWQRGTSSTALGAYGTADRWVQWGNGTVTFSQENSIVPQGFKYSIKGLTGASSSYAEVYNHLENLQVVSLQGKTVTASAYFYMGAGYTGSGVLELQYNTTSDAATGGSWVSLASAYTPAAASWTRVTLTANVPSNAYGLRLKMGNSSVQSSGVAIYFAGAQLEAGSVATPFSRAGGTLQGELAACQRYYWRTTANSGDAYVHFGYGMALSTTTAGIQMRFPVTMRIPPSSVDSSLLRLTDEVSAWGYTGLALSHVTSDTTMVYITGSSGLTQYKPLFLTGTSTSAYIGFSAEL